jgi:3-methyladenine DNA glycosylase AlkD
MDPLYRQIQASILAVSDESVRAKLARLIPGARTTGAKVPGLRELVEQFHRNNPALTLEQACDLMDELCQGRVREEILFGAFLLGGYGKKLASLPWGRLEPWIEALDNWETCDQLASNVSGAVVASNLALVDNLVMLTRSENPWKRRFALATTSELNHKGRSHPGETFRVCTPLLDDPEPTVRKAVGWALKEASKKAENQVYEFLLKRRERIPASVLREASEKLSPAHRAQLL